MKREEIYGYIIEKADLIHKHIEELTIARGFKDEIVKSHKFRSAGKELAALEIPMKEKFSARDLLETGVFIPHGKDIQISPMLLQDRIIIPYINSKDDIYHMRFSLPKYLRDKERDTPKMLGFRDLAVDIYQERNLVAGTYDVVITEGEFKAVAGMQLGIPTLSIPGIGSFSKQHFPKLVEMLKAGKIKKVYILFDNEVKDDPALPTYKSEPHKRYDTQYYAALMAYKLETAGFEALVAWMPDAWRVNGKIDIDGALAAGKDTGDFYRILRDAKTRNEFVNSLTKDAHDVVKRKLSQNFHKSKIQREYNKYVATRTRGRMNWTEEVSNFILRVVATHDTAEGVRRSIEFTDESGKTCGPFSIGPKEMATSDAFRVFCLDRGGFIWRGTNEDLMTIWESEFLLQDEGRTIRESDHIGYVAELHGWLFQNCFIKDDGTVLKPDKDGIFWMDKNGIRPVPLSMDEKRGSADGIPSLYMGQHPIDAKELHQMLADSIGFMEASLLIGWVNAVVFMEEVFAACGSFPFLFVTGQWQSGKSTVASWASHIFGIENAAKAISQTTPVAIQRCLAYYSSLPTMLDEYRNSREITQTKNGFLRNAYNRQSAGKGTKNSYHSVREARVRGTLIVIGEETPKDGALWSRFITIYVSKKNRQKDQFKWLNANRSRFSSHYLDLLKRKKDLKPRFMEIFNARKEHFTKILNDDRIAFNYAAVVAGFEIMFGEMNIDDLDGLIGKTQEMQQEFHEERAISVFFEDLSALATRRVVGPDYWCVEDGKIYLYFHGLMQAWAEQYRKVRGEEAFKEASIRAYLKEEPGFIDSNFFKRINGVPKKCIVFDAAQASQGLLTLVGAGSFATGATESLPVSGSTQGRPF